MMRLWGGWIFLFLISLRAWLGAEGAAGAAEPASASVVGASHPEAARFSLTFLNTDSGLPQNDVRFVQQAADGAIWAGTIAGPFRHDSQRGESYKPDASINVPNWNCLATAVDSDGTLWIGTSMGLLKSAPGGLRFNSLTARYRINSLCARRAGGVWLGTIAGPAWVHQGKLAFLKDVPGLGLGDRPFGEGRRSVKAILETAEGDLWLGDDSGVWRRRGDQPWEAVYLSVASNSGRGAQHLRSTPDGSVWFGNEWGLFQWRADRLFWHATSGPSAGWTNLAQAGLRIEAPAHPLNLPAQPVRAVALGQNGVLWIGMETGLYCAQPWLGEVGGFHPAEKVTLPELVEEPVNSLCVGHDGLLWIGTRTRGLGRLHVRPFATYRKADGLPHDNVWSLHAGPDGTPWAATSAGAARFTAGRWQPIMHQHDGSMYRRQQVDFNTVFADREGRVWFGGNYTLRRMHPDYPEGLAQFLTNGHQVTHVQTIFQDKGRRLWMGTDTGLLMPKSDHWTPATLPDLPPSISVWGMCEDAEGALWVGTLSSSRFPGLLRWHQGRLTTYTTRDGLPSDSCGPALAETNGAVWFASEAGLIRWRDGRFFTFTTAQGLVENVSLNVLDDGLGFFWLNGYHGIQRVRRDELEAVAAGRQARVQAVNFGVADGLASTEGNGERFPNSCRTADGRLWFPTVKGVACVQPVELPTAPPPLPVHLGVVRADGVVLAGAAGTGPGGKSARPELSVAPGGLRVLEVEYAAVDFVAPEKVRFRYRLTGLDDQWVEAGTRRVAHFANLRPGRYQFEVRAADHHGVWNEAGATLALLLPPRYYQTLVFQLFAAASVLGLLASGVRWRLRIQRRFAEQERRHALELERARIARDLHDNLGAGLSQVALLGELAGQGASPAEGNQAQLRQLTDQARAAARSLNEVVWAASAKHDNLASLVNYLADFAPELLAAAQVRCRLELPPDVPALPLDGRVRRELLLLLKEALNNLVRHARATEATLTVKLEPQTLHLTLADNGCGFDPAEAAARPRASGGNGLSNYQARAQALGGTVQIISAPGQGATVHVAVPLSH